MDKHHVEIAIDHFLFALANIINLYINSIGMSEYSFADKNLPDSDVSPTWARHAAISATSASHW